MRSLAADPANMVGYCLDVVIDVRIEMRTSLMSESSTLNHMEQMRDDAGFDDALAILVEINAPGIARAFGKNFEFVFDGVVAPYARVDPRALAVRRTRLADI